MAASNTHTVKIGDNEFLIRRFNPFLAWEMFGDLQKELLPSVSELLIAVAAKAPADKAAQAENVDDGRVLAEGISKLSAKLGGERMKYWAERLFNPEYVSVSINGNEPVKMDKAMANLAFSDFTEIAQLVFEILKFNYAGPMAGFLSRIGLDTSRMNTALKSL
jgi:hypothetical protein